LAALLAQQAWAYCQNPQPRDVCAEFANSQAVVIAKLQLVRSALDSDGETDGWFYTLAARRVLPGKLDAIPDVTIVAAGKDGRHFATRADSHGRFEIRLPPGNYTLKSLARGWSFKPNDFTYENPNDLRITPGYCAQVQFDGMGQPPVE